MDEKNLFLGTGWNFPPSFAEQGAVVMTVSGEEDIKQSLKILLTTELGERWLHPYYGGELNQFLYQELSPGLINQIKSTLAEAILLHEPRISVDDISVTVENSTQVVLLININFTIRATNSRSNLVYPFYLNEASYGFNNELLP